MRAGKLTPAHTISDAKVFAYAACGIGGTMPLPGLCRLDQTEVIQEPQSAGAVAHLAFRMRHSPEACIRVVSESPATRRPVDSVWERPLRGWSLPGPVPSMRGRHRDRSGWFRQTPGRAKAQS